MNLHLLKISAISATHSFSFSYQQNCEQLKKRNYKVCYLILTVIIVRTAAKTTERKWVRFIICQHDLKKLYYACNNFQISWKAWERKFELNRKQKKKYQEIPVLVFRTSGLLVLFALQILDFPNLPWNSPDPF